MVVEWIPDRARSAQRGCDCDDHGNGRGALATRSTRWRLRPLYGHLSSSRHATVGKLCARLPGEFRIDEC